MYEKIPEELKRLKQWVCGYEGLYEIDVYGNVYSIQRTTTKGGKLKPQKAHGYYRVALTKNGKTKCYFVHRLVAAAFLEKPKGKDFINHKDFDRGNNNVSNLEWVTQKENLDYSKHKMRHPRLKTRPSSTGEHHISVKWCGKKKNIKYYLVSIMHEEKHFKTLEDAIQYRDEQLRRWGVG